MLKTTNSSYLFLFKSYSGINFAAIISLSQKMSRFCHLLSLWRFWSAIKPFQITTLSKFFVFVSMKFEITRKLMTFRCLGNRIISIKIDAPDNFFITRKNVRYFLNFFSKLNQKWKEIRLFCFKYYS